VQAYVSRGDLHVLKREYEKALADFSKPIELGPENSGRWVSRARVYVRQGKWDAAVADLSQAVQLDPANAEWWIWLASARLGAGRPDEFRKDFAGMLQRFGQTDNPHDAAHVAECCVLAPDATADWPSVIALAEKSTSSDPNRWGYGCVLGAVLYRAGRFEDAVQRLTQADQLAKDDFLTAAEPWFFLAMAHHGLGHSEEAKQWLDKAMAWTENAQQQQEQGVEEFDLMHAVRLRLLRQEAETLLKPDTGNAPQIKDGQPTPKP
jgi:tetratricopeptide (TPR) repeat protein